MALKSTERTRVAARIAARTKHHGPDDPELPALRRDMLVASLAERIREVVDAAPPLTPEQVSRLRSLLDVGGAA